MRQLIQTINAMATQDGDGVNIHRIGGRQLNCVIDPFLMIDEINSDEAADYIGGFPEHPHRGFETISYMKAGRMRHRDHMGNEGVIEAGDVQWMTAGRGVLHSEMPEQDSGQLHGFQIWLNLPASEKMKAAAYREIASNTINEWVLNAGGLLRVIAGDIEVDGQQVTGALSAQSTEPVLVDIQLNAQESIELKFNAHNPAWLYVYEGEIDNAAEAKLKPRQMGVFSSGERLQIQAGVLGAKALLLSGKPIKEAIAQYGPFVMNTNEQIEQAISDYKQGKLV